MLFTPETRPSLIVRLHDARDGVAWEEFLTIYEPLILRLLATKGLQESDARDVCQEVLSAVARDIEQWKPDGATASFRRWLFRIARNRAMKFLGQIRSKRSIQGGTWVQELLAAHPDDRANLSDEFDREYRQQLLICATEQIRPEFRENTWQAFWQTCVNGRPVTEVAAELGMTVGNVYVSRSRIVARLRNRLTEMQDME